MPRPKGRTLTQTVIVEAAIGCLEKEGEVALGVNRVARELGIQPPSLYNHLAGNEALRQAVVIEGIRRLLSALRHQAKRSTNRTPQARIRQAAHNFRQFVHKHPVLYTVMATVKLDPNAPDSGPVVQDVLSFYTECLEPLGLSDEEMIHASRLFASALQGFMQIELSGQFVRSHSLDESYSWMVERLIQAMQPAARNLANSNGED